MKRAKSRLRKTSSAAEDRIRRIRLLNDEVVQIRQATIDRTKGLETKLASVGVTAGVLVGFNAVELSSPCGCFVWLPFALALATMVVAAIGLNPVKYQVSSAKAMVEKWADGDLTPDALDDNLLEVRVQEVTSREQTNKSKVILLRLGLSLLLITFAATAAVTTSSIVIL